MNSLCDLSHHPIAFFVGYLKRRPISHAVIFTAVLMAVACSVGAQYGVKFLVDTLAGGTRPPRPFGSHSDCWSR